MSDETNADAASEALAAAIALPRRRRLGDAEIEQRSLAELIEAEKHQRSKTAGSQAGFGLRIRQCKPPGAA